MISKAHQNKIAECDFLDENSDHYGLGIFQAVENKR